MKRVNIALSIIGACGLLFFVYADVYNRDPGSSTTASVLFATIFLAGYLGEQIRRK